VWKRYDKNEMPKWLGNNKYTTIHPVTIIVWIVLELILHTIISCEEEGNVKLGDDRRGGSNNITQHTTYILLRGRSKQKKERTNNQMQ
jgi:hypothetical protein